MQSRPCSEAVRIGQLLNLLETALKAPESLIFNMSNPNLEPIKAWRPEDLNERQDIITKLYWDENQDLPKVMEMMELQYRFKAR